MPEVLELKLYRASEGNLLALFTKLNTKRDVFWSDADHTPYWLQPNAELSGSSLDLQHGTRACSLPGYLRCCRVETQHEVSRLLAHQELDAADASRLPHTAAGLLPNTKDRTSGLLGF